MFIKTSSFNVLYTKSIEKTHNFYQQLGLEIKNLEPDKVVVIFGDFELHFILAETVPFAAYHYQTVATEYGKGVIFYIETDSIEADLQLITKAGGTIKAPVFQNMWECKELLFEDPNGYAFALYQG